MSLKKISTEIEEHVWEELVMFAKESHQDVSDLLADAIKNYLQRQCEQAVVRDHLSGSMAENDELGSLLSK